MFTPDENGVYLAVEPATGRRVLALTACYGLGVLALWLAFSSSLGVMGTLTLVLFGLWVLVTADKMRRATQGGILLTVDGLKDMDGDLLASWDEIDKVERGTFAVKPSNGFSLTLKSPKSRRWKPGLWWRTRWRVGVGGVLPGPQVRTMAEQIALHLPQKQNGA